MANIVVTPQKLENCNVLLGIAVYAVLIPGSITFDIFGNIIQNPDVTGPIAFTVKSVTFENIDKNNQVIGSGSIDFGNPSTNSISINPKDGHTQYTIIVMADGEEISSTYNVFMTCDLDECFEGMEAEYKYTCENNEGLMDYIKVKVTKEVIEELLAEGKLNQASCLLAGINGICDDNKNCVSC